MVSEIRDAMGRCVEALRSNNAARMALLYVPAAPQDRANREKLLTLMRRSESRLSVVGVPDVVAAPEIDGESARADFTVRLTWRTNFGGRPEIPVRFRATIAPDGSESQIACRILGNADL